MLIYSRKAYCVLHHSDGWSCFIYLMFIIIIIYESLHKSYKPCKELITHLSEVPRKSVVIDCCFAKLNGKIDQSTQRPCVKLILYYRLTINSYLTSKMTSTLTKVKDALITNCSPSQYFTHTNKQIS